MPQQENKPFQWDDEKVRDFAELYREIQGNPPPELWGEDLLEVFKASHSSSEKVEKQPLFTTEDGKEVTSDNETVFSVYPDNWSTTSQMAVFVKKLDKRWKHFSSKEARDEYVTINKPCLSVEDVHQWLYKHEAKIGLDFEALESIASSKIKGE